MCPFRRGRKRGKKRTKVLSRIGGICLLGTLNLLKNFSQKWCERVHHWRTMKKVVRKVIKMIFSGSQFSLETSLFSISSIARRLPKLSGRLTTKEYFYPKGLSALVGFSPVFAPVFGPISVTMGESMDTPKWKKMGPGKSVSGDIFGFGLTFCLFLVFSSLERSLGNHSCQQDIAKVIGKLILNSKLFVLISTKQHSRICVERGILTDSCRSDLKWHLTFAGNGCHFLFLQRKKQIEQVQWPIQGHTVGKEEEKGLHITGKETLCWSRRSLNARAHSALKVPFLTYQQWHQDNYFDSVYSAKPDLAKSYLSILVLNIFKFNNSDCYWKRNKALPRILTVIGFIWCLWNRLRVYLSYLCVPQRLVWGSVEVCISN